MSATIAIFDVDGTLVRPPSSEVRFVRFLVSRRVIGARALGAYLSRLPAGLRREGLLAFKTNKAHLAGIEAARLASLAEAFVEEAGEALWHAGIRDRLRAHQAQGDAVALLTGTPDFLAGALAARLGAGMWEATVLDTDAGRVTTRPVRQHPHGPGKLEIARRMAARLGADLGRAWAYGDSWADRHLLAAVGHPVVVAPGRRLARLAQEGSWETLRPQS